MTTNSIEQAEMDECRADFEAWYGNGTYATASYGADELLHLLEQARWEAWQAAWQARATTKGRDGAEDEYIRQMLEKHADRAGMFQPETEVIETRWVKMFTPQQGQDGVVSAALAEVQKATSKFPTWPTDPLHALAVLGEEFGELTKATLQHVYEPHKSTAEDVKTEAVQTAAMALRFLASLEVYEYARATQHEQVAMQEAKGQGGSHDLR